MPVDNALAAAEAEGLDLVEIAANARPPIVRIMDYGKYRRAMAGNAVEEQPAHVTRALTRAAVPLTRHFADETLDIRTSLVESWTRA